MAKPKAVPKSTDDFAAWLTQQLPDGVWSHITVTRTFRRDGGRVHTSFEMALYFDLNGHHFERQSHDFAELARWFINDALPAMAPRPPSKPVRKITVQRPALEHHPPQPLFD